jgi:predicted YcjX-like family ATPase
MKTLEEYLAKAEEWIDTAERLDFYHVAEAAHCAEISQAYTALAQFVLANSVATVEAGARRTSRAMIENP